MTTGAADPCRTLTWTLVAEPSMSSADVIPVIAAALTVGVQRASRASRLEIRRRFLGRPWGRRTGSEPNILRTGGNNMERLFLSHDGRHTAPPGGPVGSRSPPR